jgi:hypothetical protein
MLTWLVAAGAGLAVALILYGAREPGGLSRALPAAALRALALTLLFALLLDAPAGRRRAAAPIVALDASASWLRGGDDARWREASARARRLAGDTLWLFGDSLRAAGAPAAPGDLASRAAPVAERALAAGRPVLLVTDGELDDAPALGALPSGSRLEVVDPAARVDVAVVALDAPRAVVAGDTIEIAVTLRAGSVAAPEGALALLLAAGEGEPRRIGEARVQPLAAGAERRLTIRAPLAAAPPDPTGPARSALLTAALALPGDTEPRNDSVRVPVEIMRAAGAVLVSTSPDQDARYLVPVLRGAVSLPTRAYYEVTPGSWRLEGALSEVPESEVRAALREAPLAILHGDTAAFGPPRALGAGALVLLPATTAAGEWYAAAAPPSPVSGALSGVAWDSLPPLELAQPGPRGEWEVLVASRARESERRPVIVGSEQPRRVVVVGGAGFWRWAFRGGASADAFTALWGGIFDWASAARADRRGAIPAEGIVRAGERIRWRRGSSTDSLVPAVLRARGAPSGDAARADTVLLRFGGAGSVAESAPLPAGVYDVELPGGSALLAVNASRELVPRAPAVRTGAVGGRVATGEVPRLRDRGWPWMLALAALCAEWLLRRRLGMR